GIGQLQVPGQEVGVEVRLDDPLDGQTVGGGVGEVLADVALGIDDDRSACGLVADQVAELREAAELVLLEDHRSLRGSGSRAQSPFCRARSRCLPGSRTTKRGWVPLGVDDMIPYGVCAEQRRASSVGDRPGPGAAPTWNRSWATCPRRTDASVAPAVGDRPAGGSSAAAADADPRPPLCPAQTR